LAGFCARVGRMIAAARMAMAKEESRGIFMGI
jgi:hypothetical protein